LAHADAINLKSRLVIVRKESAKQSTIGLLAHLSAGGQTPNVSDQRL
jgi:hypothetical protein